MGLENARTENLKLYSLNEFNKSDLSKTMSYDDYLKTFLSQKSLYEVPSDLKLNNPHSAFGFGFKTSTNPLEIKKELAMQDAQELKEEIESELEARSKEADEAKDKAEEEYYIALNQAKIMQNAQNEAHKRVQEELKTARRKTGKYKKLLDKFNNLQKLSLDANINWEIARDRFNNANKVAYNTFLSTRSFD